MKEEDILPLSVDEAYLVPISTDNLPSEVSPDRGEQTSYAQLSAQSQDKTQPLRKAKRRRATKAEDKPEERLSINEWALEDRPREKLLEKGPEALSEAELLAILIGSGSPKESAVDLMRRVMNDHANSLKQLGRMSLQELTAYNGLGPAKAVTIMAACELGKRRMREPADEKQAVTSSEDLFRLFRSRMMDLRQEQCHMLLLDVKNHVVGYHVVSSGGVTSSQVDVRVVLRQALLSGAVSLAFCHNHPSGNPKPSGHDDDLTSQLALACKAVNIKLIDHIVLGDNQYFSYYDAGKL